MVALKLITSGCSLQLAMASSRATAGCHWWHFSRELNVALNVMRSWDPLGAGPMPWTHRFFCGLCVIMGYPRHFLWDIKEDIGGYIYIYNCNKMGIWMGVAMEKIGLRMGCKSQSYEDLSRKYGDWMGRNRRYHQQYRISPWQGDVSWNIVRISWEFHEIFLGILMGYCQGYHGDIMR